MRRLRDGAGDGDATEASRAAPGNDLRLPGRDARSGPCPPRTLVVAAYASARAGVRALLAENNDDNVHIIGDIENADLLARLLPDMRPDVLVLEAAPSERQGGGDERAANVAAVLDALNAYAQMSASAETPALVVLGDAPSRAVVSRLAAASLPGWAYLLRAEADAVRLQNAVRAAASGLVVLDAAVSLALLRDATAERTNAGKAQTASYPAEETLTPREVDVLEKMAEGLPNKIIAVRLGISLHTVKFHVAQILGKLNASSRTEAVTVGARRGFITI